MPYPTASNYSRKSALDYHNQGKPGKWEINPTKPVNNAEDLALAYSPGVACPVQEIHRNPELAYKYTNKGNTVAVISNGTAVLGLGDLGALASKPVMEGKSILFKKFAKLDSVDIEVDTKDPEEFINCVRYLAPAFGGINLEDIKAPESMIIEARLKALMDIPVFHDDQHGTAIVVAAALINALHITKKKIGSVRIAVAGAGSAALAVAVLLKCMGAEPENVILCDEYGTLNGERRNSLDGWRAEHALNVPDKDLDDAMRGADVAIGLSAAGVFTTPMIASMAHNPIVFAMANPTPEILPEEIISIRSDAIIATGRSDYPNQVNNVLSFPYIFRGALDVRASTINEPMKLACAFALAKLAREYPSSEIQNAHPEIRKFGRDYILPTTFDPRLITCIPPTVAQAAMESGVSRVKIDCLQGYADHLSKLK